MIDMTKGRPLPLIWRFAVPIILSNIFMMLYTMADSMIVGQWLGPEAFAAIGAAGYLHGFPQHMLGGMSHGFGVWLAQRCGAKDASGFRRAMSGTLMLEMGSALVMIAFFLIFLQPLLHLMQTPQEMMEPSVAYLRVMMGGLVFSALYSSFSAALLAIGDSKTIFVSGLAANLLNVALDFVLIGQMGFGVVCAAMTTVIAQAVSVLICFAGMVRAKWVLPKGRDWLPNRRDMKQLIRLGAPQLTGKGVNSIGEIVVQSVMNACGVEFVAGMMAARKYYSLLNIIGSGLEGAAGTFAGQNTGARSKERILLGTRVTVRLALAITLGIAVLVGIFAKPMILLLLPDASAETLRIGMAVLRIDAVGMIALYMLCIHRAAIQGMGNALIPMLCGFMELGMRVGCAFALPLLAGPESLFFIEAINWTVTGAVMMVSYRRISRKLQFD